MVCGTTADLLIYFHTLECTSGENKKDLGSHTYSPHNVCGYFSVQKCVHVIVHFCRTCSNIKRENNFTGT